MLHRQFERLVVFGAAILFLAYAFASDQPTTTTESEPDLDPSDDSDESSDRTTVVDIAGQAGRFGTWNLAIRQAGLVPELETDGPFTVFAPTDDAFGSLEEKLDELLADERRLAGILRRHIVPGRYQSADLSDGLQLKTLAETDLTIAVSEGTVSVSGADVVDADLTATNGIVHGIAAILLPPDSKGDRADES